jgi:large subunit ribosomal protein L1
MAEAKVKKTKPVEEEVIIKEVVTKVVTETKVTKVTAKACKRSSKSLEEAAVKEAKAERKTSTKDEPSEVTANINAKPSRTRLERKSKKYQDSSKKVDTDKIYALNEAVKTTKEASYVKFDATVELHMNLSVDPRHADQNVRDNLVLPAGTGKTIKVAVLSDDDAAAKAAGADIFGSEELLASLDKGIINFDILIATPQLMAKLGKFARTLGPRGLMPNPKSGTVTTDVKKAVSEAKAGRVEYRVDASGIVHIGVGKVSFADDKLVENLQAVISSIKSNKPASVKGNYIKSAYLTSTMGPSIKLDLTDVA